MKHQPPCPACDSAYTIFVQDVVGRRTGNRFPQYVCLDCRTFFNPSGYKETAEQQEADASFLLAQSQGHSILMGQLALEILTRAPGIQTFCEIGHGAGWLMKGFTNFGITTYGFEVNSNCHDHAANVLGLPCCLGLFDASHSTKYDLIASVMVFEHLERPRDLFRVMVENLNPDGAIYLCVPFVERDSWRFLWNADQTTEVAPPNPFHDNDVHITHFTIEGMKRMGMDIGARQCEYWVSKDTYQNSPGSFHGILFRF